MSDQAGAVSPRSGSPALIAADEPEEGSNHASAAESDEEVVRHEDSHGVVGKVDHAERE
jgi:hypothetical protein